jgi:surface polysaccharide O-acyltransferase-like enzyme
LDSKVAETTLPVDLIRTIAIVLVITLHAATEGYPLSVTQMSEQFVTKWWTVNIYDSIGRFGVPLFVMLSGALLLQPSKLTEPMGVFFKKRLNRIALPFFFWAGIYFAWRFLADGEVFSWNVVGYGLLTSPYVQFWFLYMLFGLYLITPALRVLVGHADKRVFRYFLLLLLLGTVVLPIVNLLGTSLNSNLFLVTGWIGYFLLGAYLTQVHARPRTILYLGLVFGVVWTILGTYFITDIMGQQFSQFFYDAFSLNVIVGSVAIFALLCNVQSSKPDAHKTSRFTSNVLLREISQNVLAIYFMFMIVLETLQRGYLGVRVSLETINPIIEVPLITIVTLFICLGASMALRKIPYVKRLIG